MANQIVQVGRRVVLNANRVSSSVNFFRSPNRFDHRPISRLFKPFRKDALAQEEHLKMKLEKFLFGLRDATNKFNNKLDQEEDQKKKMELEKLRCELREVVNKFINNLDQEELVSERQIKTFGNEIAKLRRERWGIIFKDLTKDPLYPHLRIRDISSRIRYELIIQNLDTINHNNESDQGMADNVVYIGIRKSGWKLRDIFNELINVNNTVDQEERQKKKIELEKLRCELRDIMYELFNNLYRRAF